MSLAQGSSLAEGESMRACELERGLCIEPKSHKSPMIRTLGFLASPVADVFLHAEHP